MTLKDYALDYARKGFRVFPLIPGTKKPLTEHGVKDASANEFQIIHWWNQHPDANIGLAMGAGYIAIDCDFDEEHGIDGPSELRRWQVEYGMLPDTVINLTGRGGYQLIYKIPDDTKVGNRVGLLDGVDVRGDGGYIVAPPSIHPNGRRYEWEVSPDDIPIAEANKIVAELLATDQKAKGPFHAPEEIPEGKRNHTLFREACSMRAKNFSDMAIFAAIAAENDEKCNPPLTDKEIRQLVNSALQYPAGGDSEWEQKIRLIEAVKSLISE